jgi:hypothetical protein
MPPDHGLRLHNDQGLGPAEPGLSQGRPEQSIPPIQPRARTLSFQDGDLLPKGQDLQGSVVSTAEENSNGGQEGESESEQKRQVVARLDSVRLHLRC